MQRAVEKLNSAQDSRESFFRNKVSSLMVKPNVLKVMANSNKKEQDVSSQQPNFKKVTEAELPK
jgi:hypothetical protein